MRVTVESHEKNGTAVSVHSKMESGYDNRLVICDREGEGSGGGTTSPFRYILRTSTCRSRSRKDH